MLVEELLGYRLQLEDVESIDSDLKYAIDDLILQLRKSNTAEIDFNLFAKELDRAVDGIVVDINDSEFKNVLIQQLEKNDWVKEITNDKIVIKKDGDLKLINDPGAEMKAARKKQTDKVSKQAMKNVKDKSSGKEL